MNSDMRRWLRALADDLEGLPGRLTAAGIVPAKKSEDRARAIFAAVAGAQLMARSRSDVSLFDTLIESYRATGLLPS